MSTYFYLICDDTRFKTDAGYSSGGNYRLTDCDLVASFLYMHRFKKIELTSEHDESLGYYKNWGDLDEKTRAAIAK